MQLHFQWIIVGVKEISFFGKEEQNYYPILKTWVVDENESSDKVLRQQSHFIDVFVNQMASQMILTPHRFSDFEISYNKEKEKNSEYESDDDSDDDDDDWFPAVKKYVKNPFVMSFLNGDITFKNYVNMILGTYYASKNKKFQLISLYSKHKEEEPEDEEEDEDYIKQQEDENLRKLLNKVKLVCENKMINLDSKSKNHKFLTRFKKDLTVLEKNYLD